jgi:hypothetical protein
MNGVSGVGTGASMGTLVLVSDRSNWSQYSVPRQTRCRPISIAAKFRRRSGRDASSASISPSWNRTTLEHLRGAATASTCRISSRPNAKSSSDGTTLIRLLREGTARRRRRRLMALSQFQSSSGAIAWSALHNSLCETAP